MDYVGRTVQYYYVWAGSRVELCGPKAAVITQVDDRGYSLHVFGGDTCSICVQEGTLWDVENWDKHSKTEFWINLPYHPDYKT